MHWIQRIEAEYDQPIEELLAIASIQAEHTGISLPMLAEEWGVTRRELDYLRHKLGIHWPRFASARVKEHAATQARRNARKAVKLHATIDGKRDTLTNHARRLGVNESTVRWRIKRWDCTPEEALLMPLVSHKERGRQGMQERYGRRKSA